MFTEKAQPYIFFSLSQITRCVLSVLVSPESVSQITCYVLFVLVSPESVSSDHVLLALVLTEGAAEGAKKLVSVRFFIPSSVYNFVKK